VTLLPGGGYRGPGVARLICTPVRTAGPVGAPAATLFGEAHSFVSMSPDPYSAAGRTLPRPTTIAATFDGSVARVDASSFIVTGSQSGRRFLGETYAGVGTLTVTTPSTTFFPGELVDVTLTGRLGSCVPRVARYRVAVGGGGGILSPTLTLDAGDGLSSVVAADLDGDGDLDLAASNRASNTVALYQNVGGGSFPTIDTVTVGSAPFAVTTSDLDGDGDIDLATVNAQSNDVTILQNDGTGGFAVIGAAAVGVQPSSIIAADLDGDGDADLVTTDFTSSTVSVLKNDGAGAFTSAGGASVGDRPESVVAADVDGDGDLDLATADQQPGTVTILENDGTGHFSALDTAVVGSGPRSLVAADLNGDGHVDLAVVNGGANTVTILENDGQGVFDASGTLATLDPPADITAGDLDGDGDVDLAVSEGPDPFATSDAAGEVSIFRNNGAGSFTADFGTPVVQEGPNSIIAADLDDDGDLDLAVTNGASNTISVLIHQGP
jgi:hypothetical protein